jgi:Flp pilus assembly pilin Flp
MLKLISKHLRTSLHNEQGGQVLEYALVIGLIVVAAIAVIASVGTKTFTRYDSVNQALDATP